VAKKVKKTAKKATTKATAKTAVKKPAAAKKPASLPTKNSTKGSSAAKKAVVKKTTPASPAAEAKPKAVQVLTKTYLTDAELERFKQILMEKLQQLSGDVDSIESEALRKNRSDASGDLSSMPIHMADIGSDNFEQDFALGLMSSERKIVAEIVAALKRIQNGTYGICEGTGRPVPKARLEACPWARYCVEYATRLEKGQLTRQEESHRWAHRHAAEIDESGEEVETEDEEEDDVEDEDEDEFDAVETDPDLDDLYEVEEDESEPSADDKMS
jgi:RNA polymerase-binding transcription factor DksA